METCSHSDSSGVKTSQAATTIHFAFLADHKLKKLKKAKNWTNTRTFPESLKVVEHEGHGDTNHSLSPRNRFEDSGKSKRDPRNKIDRPGECIV